jgi:hypothetical protein
MMPVMSRTAYARSAIADAIEYLTEFGGRKPGQAPTPEHTTKAEGLLVEALLMLGSDPDDWEDYPEAVAAARAAPSYREPSL